MKRGSTIALFLSTLAIICLLGLAAFVTVYMNDNSSPPGTSPAVSPENESESDTSTQILDAGETIITGTNPFDENAEEPEHSYIFVGDSRTVGMRTAVLKENSGDTCTYIAKSGEGFYWLYHDGIVALEEALRSDPYATVIFNPGVNDLDEVERYIDFYKELFSVYHDPSFYLMSVNPVDDEECIGASNEEIESFNERIQEEFPDKYLDCYHYLLSEDFETVDGLHYTNRIYQMIHRFAVMTLTERE